MSGVEKLVAALDLDTQAVLYSFSKGTEFDQPFTLVSSPIAYAGKSYGYDPLGRRAAPVAPGRKTTWRFIHPHIGGEGWSTIKNAIIAAIGDGRRFLLEKQLSDGTTLVTAPARLVDFPDAERPENTLYSEHTLTFEQYADWQSVSVVGLKWDSGLHWDAGLRWDTVGTAVPIIGQSTPFTLTNNGTVTDYDVIVTLNGPLTAPFTIGNQSCDIHGAPVGSGGTFIQTTITLTIPSGQYIVLDSGKGTVSGTVAGIVPWLTTVRVPGQDFYFAVCRGANACFLNQASSVTGGNVNVRYHDRYR
jgi:hypothetical protein